MQEFQGKVIVVTGGSNGIGAEIVRTFSRLGATVLLNYNHSHEAALAIEEECQQFDGSVILKQGSIEDIEFIKQMFKEVMVEYGRIDFLVNNAGINKDGFLMTTKLEDIQRIVDTNLLGTIRSCKMVIPHMIKNKSGKIINIASVAGIKGSIGQTAYSATKAGIIGLTRSLALELSRFNIQVNAVAPGFINTEMTKKLPERVKSEYANTIPIKRFGEAAEVANLVKFLCSDECSYILGQTIVIDGGLSC